MSTFRSLTTDGRRLSRRAAIALAGLALSLALIVGSSPAHAASRPAVAPSQNTKAPPVLSARTREALASQLDRRLSKLGKGPTVRQLEALGLRPDPKQLAARFNKLAHSTRARAADIGSTYWFTYQYYGHVWADVYYTGPTGNGTYTVYSNYKICPLIGPIPVPVSVFGAPTAELDGCMHLNVYTYILNIAIDGRYYYLGLSSFNPDSAGMPEYGFGPFSG